jgi:alkylation response protein AidB-like acyl-CoA dehydrogenase
VASARYDAQYVFLATNTDPDAPKHLRLTMFLVPMDTPGVEIQPIRTVDGDRTNVTYYSDVRIDDRYRVGEVNGGWTVLREALNAEHGTVERDAHGLQKLAVMTVGVAHRHLRRHAGGVPQHDRPARTGTWATELLAAGETDVIGVCRSVSAARMAEAPAGTGEVARL